MESQIGKTLDTKIHEPITVSPGEKDIIIEEFEKGYLLGEKVLRPAKVKVGNGELARSVKLTLDASLLAL